MAMKNKGGDWRGREATELPLALDTCHLWTRLGDQIEQQGRTGQSFACLQTASFFTSIHSCEETSNLALKSRPYKILDPPLRSPTPQRAHQRGPAERGGTAPVRADQRAHPHPAAPRPRRPRDGDCLHARRGRLLHQVPQAPGAGAPAPDVATAAAPVAVAAPAAATARDLMD